MRWLKFAAILLVFGCRQESEHLNVGEIEQVTNDIIQRSEKHAGDLKNLDYESVMTFYADNLIVFGDGYYWGDYSTMDGIWKGILGEGGWTQMLQWELQNHKVHVFSKSAASYLVEFDHKHLDQEGDTVMSSGNFSYAMQKIDGEWKAVTAHVSHIPVRTADDKWWSRYSPTERSNGK